MTFRDPARFAWWGFGFLTIAMFSSRAWTGDAALADDIATVLLGLVLGLPMILLGRSWIEVDGAQVRVQNPIRRYELHLRDVTDVELVVWANEFKVAYLITDTKRVPVCAIQSLTLNPRTDPFDAVAKVQRLRDAADEARRDSPG